MVNKSFCLHIFLAFSLVGHELELEILCVVFNHCYYYDDTLSYQASLMVYRSLALLASASKQIKEVMVNEAVLSTFFDDCFRVGHEQTLTSACKLSVAVIFYG